MMRRFELLTILSLASAYFLRVFLFEELFSHHGPAKNQDIRIKRFDAHGEYYDAPQTLIDRVRQATPMKPYIIRGDEWIVDSEKMEVWECPKCLSPYIAFAVTIPLMLLYGRWRDIPLMWAGVTGGGYLIYSIIERLQTYTAEAAFEEDV